MIGRSNILGITDIPAQNNGTEGVHCADNSGLACCIGTIDHRRAQTLNILTLFLDIEQAIVKSLLLRSSHHGETGFFTERLVVLKTKF